MSYLKYDGSTAAESANPVSNLYGTPGAETLSGTGAAETLWGQGGDTLIGGAGDDTYYLQDAADKVVEQPGGGTDTLVAWQSINLKNFANVENLKIDGAGIYAAGDAHDNITIQAGAGPDTFHTFSGAGMDRVLGFDAAKGDHV